MQLKNTPLYPLPPTEYIKKYATVAALREQDGDSSSSESEVSDLSDEDEVQDMEL